MSLEKAFRQAAFVASAFFALAVPARAASPVVTTKQVEAEVFSEQRVARAGAVTLLGLRLRMEPGWHTYWKNPGDTGLPTRIQWKLPEGWSAGEVEWPYPSRESIGPLVNFGYQDEVVLLTPVGIPRGSAPATYAIAASAEWLVCKDVCIPQKGEFALDLRVSEIATEVDPRWAAQLERTRSAYPVDAVDWRFSFARDGRSLVLQVTAPGSVEPPRRLVFFPDASGIIENAAEQTVTRQNNQARIRMLLAEGARDTRAVTGVLVAPDGFPALGRKAVKVEAVPSDEAAVHWSGVAIEAGPTTAYELLLALGLAFAGGLLLNLMPCVFPLLGIKVLGFVRHAHGDPRILRMQGVLFAAGVLAAFLALGALLMAFRAAGAQLGWGFQLQSPVVVVALALLLFLLALNLAGVYEWRGFAQSVDIQPPQAMVRWDSFLSGVLVTLIAAPCTAPFMGAAVGFTLLLPAAMAMAIFAALAVGMAIPTVALSFMPTLVAKLPRPGPWMVTFKQALAFPLYATVAWLTWVLGAQAGNDAVLALLAGLILTALAAWVCGNGPALSWKRKTAVAIAGIAALTVALPSALLITDAKDHSGVSESNPQTTWRPWSALAVTEELGRGRAVFVDFTAAWCISCQVNKRLVLDDAAVRAAFIAKSVTMMRADWTKQDPAITAALRELGRNSVPVYALYLPGQSAPRLLPEILTKGAVEDALRQVGDAARDSTPTPVPPVKSPLPPWLGKPQPSS